ncbi:MAG: glycosyltransferase family 4 protein [Phycisphaerales bacterium]
MRVTIFEYSDGGHRLTYVRQILNALAGQAGLQISVVVSSGAAQSEAFRHQVEPWKDRFPVRVVPGDYRAGARRRDLFKLAVKKIEALGEAIALTRPEFLILPTADGIAPLLALRSGVVEGVGSVAFVIHNAGFAHPAGNWMEMVSARTSIELTGRVPNARLHFVNALGWDYLHDRGHRFAERSDVLPDPVDAQTPREKRGARSRLGLPDDGVLIVSAGVQDRRKGIHFLVRSLAHLPERTLERTRLVLAGRCTEDIARDLGSLPQRIADRVIRIDRYLSDDELCDALSAADLVATCHPRHMGLSNIALRAVSLERPVLASDWGWLGSMVPRFDLGWSGAISDPESYAGTIVQGIEGAPDWRPSEATRALVGFHQPENFKANILGWFGIGDGGRKWAQVRESAGA